MRNYRNFKIWKEGIEIVKEVYDLSMRFPVEEKFGLKAQICRAVISVPSNIAEGSSRNSDKEFKRYLEIAMGSLFEIETQLIIAIKLLYVEESDCLSLLKRINECQRMVNGFISKLS